VEILFSTFFLVVNHSSRLFRFNEVFVFSRRFQDVCEMKGHWSADDPLTHASNRQQQQRLLVQEQPRSPRSTVTTVNWDNGILVSESCHSVRIFPERGKEFENG